MQAKPLIDKNQFALLTRISLNSTTPLATTTEDLTVETTTLFDDEATTEYASYGDNEDDQISNALTLALIG